MRGEKKGLRKRAEETSGDKRKQIRGEDQKEEETR